MVTASLARITRITVAATAINVLAACGAAPTAPSTSPRLGITQGDATSAGATRPGTPTDSTQSGWIGPNI